MTGVNGLSVASSNIGGAGVSGVGMNSLNDPSKGLLNFNIQGTNGKFNFDKICPFENLINDSVCVAAKVISNRPGVGGSNPMTNISEVGVYGSNPNLANNAAKVNVDSKSK